MADEPDDDDLPIAEPTESKKPTPVWMLPLFLTFLIPVVTVVTMVYLIIPMWQDKQDAREGKGRIAEAEALQKMEARKTFIVKELVTNLANVDGRYIRVSFTLEGTHPMFEDIVNINEARILDATIGVLQTLTLRDVDKGSVKNRIRANLIEHINRQLEPAPHVVEKLYFSEFVIQ